MKTAFILTCQFIFIQNFALGGGIEAPHKQCPEGTHLSSADSIECIGYKSGCKPGPIGDALRDRCMDKAAKIVLRESDGKCEWTCSIE